MKKKILLLSDDLRMTSGIATMSREFVMGTVHKYDWIQLGAGIGHPDIGKIFDISEDIRNRTGVSDANVKVIPYNGYGDMTIIRSLIKDEKIDAILHFTDPHYWIWLYENEHEIRQQVPILYYTIWDDLPDPKYNRNYYESCDWLGCISKQTYGIVHRVGKMDDKQTYKPLKDWQISYVPHGINENIFKPVENVSDDMKKYVYGDKSYDFILFYNNRNIKRKQPSDVIYSYKMFCDKLPKEKADKCLLLMHTSPVDEHGTDLPAVIRDLCPYNVKFSLMKFEPEKLNEIYNLVDATINIANNEGFGLASCESIMAGTPIIVNVTGGLQDQCGFKKNNKELTPDDYIEIGTLHNVKTWGHLEYGEWATPIWPAAISINGSVPTPYIFDDRVNNDDVAEAIMKVYEMGRTNRKERGLIGREWAIKNLSSKVMCEKMIQGIETTLENYKPKERFNLIKII